MDTEPMNTEPMNFMKEESQSKNYKYDLVSTIAGASIITGVNFKSRHAKIGGLAGLAIYGTTLMGGAIGYNQGKEVRLTPFQTETTRGTVVERTDGTKIPYVLDENNSYIPLSQINDTQLEEVERKYKTLESKILDSANE